VCGAEGTYTASVRLGGEHVRGSPASLSVFRDVAALAEQEIDRRLASTVASLRQSVGQTKQLHRALQVTTQHANTPQRLAKKDLTYIPNKAWLGGYTPTGVYPRNSVSTPYHFKRR
jgi:hypothetical protein